MENAVYTTLNRQSGLMAEMRAVANNIANLSTTGFRKEGVIFTEHVADLGRDEPSLSMATAEGRLVNLAQGTLVKTGGTFDLAIEGEGFFQIDTPEGPRLTRAGALTPLAAGELVDDPAQLQRRPLAIKISNAPPGFVRPQSGLNSADWVFEHTSEGSITRFTLIVYGTDVDVVGPIRSARLIDVELPAIYDAALVFSGASTGVNQRLNASDFESRIVRSADPGYFRTGEDKPFEHTLYGRPAVFREGLEALGLNTPPNFNGLLTFTSEPPAGGSPASSVATDYQWET